MVRSYVRTHGRYRNRCRAVRFCFCLVSRSGPGTAYILIGPALRQPFASNRSPALMLEPLFARVGKAMRVKRDPFRLPRAPLRTLRANVASSINSRARLTATVLQRSTSSRVHISGDSACLPGDALGFGVTTNGGRTSSFVRRERRGDSEIDLHSPGRRSRQRCRVSRDVANSCRRLRTLAHSSNASGAEPPGREVRRVLVGRVAFVVWSRVGDGASEEADGFKAR